MNNSSQSLNKSTQTTGGKINLAAPIRHVNTNTEPKLSVDKSTNTEPLIILEPSDIDKLSSGFKLVTFGTIPQIYLPTAESKIIAEPKAMTESLVPKYIPTPVSSHNRIAQNTEEIYQLLQESLHKTKTETISKV